jgi:hypothetical protein
MTNPPFPLTNTPFLHKSTHVCKIPLFVPQRQGFGVIKFCRDDFLDNFESSIKHKQFISNPTKTLTIMKNLSTSKKLTISKQVISSFNSDSYSELMVSAGFCHSISCGMF